MKKTDKLKIYPLKSQPNAKRFKDIHKHLLTPPFLLVINSTTGTGKTTLCSNIILRKNFYDQINTKYFDLFVIISPTIYNDKSSKALLEFADAVYDDYDDSIIEDLVQLQKEDETEEQHILLLIDDCVGYNMNKVKYISTRYRHFRISIIISLQAFKTKGTHPTLRQNASGYIIGKVRSFPEYRKMEENFAEQFGGAKVFKKIYDEAVKGKYNFLFLDIKNGKAYKNFQKLLYSKDDEED